MEETEEVILQRHDGNVNNIVILSPFGILVIPQTGRIIEMLKVKCDRCLLPCYANYGLATHSANNLVSSCVADDDDDISFGQFSLWCPLADSTPPLPNNASADPIWAIFY